MSAFSFECMFVLSGEGRGFEQKKTVDEVWLEELDALRIAIDDYVKDPGE